jgi:NADH-quinone oxidoreductase subunit A
MDSSVFDNNLIRFLFLFGAAGGLVAFFVALSAWLGPKSMNEIKSQPFETGMIPKTDARRPFPIKYYLVAIVFIVFDVEVAFLYPWAVEFRDLGAAGFISMMIFLVILLVGLFYAVRKRVFEWK